MTLIPYFTFLGGPSAVTDVNSEDWAPNLNLGYFKCNERPQTEASRQREERAKVREQACVEEAVKSDDVLCDDGSPIFVKDTECQTDLEAAKANDGSPILDGEL